MNDNIKQISSKILETLQSDASVTTAWQVKLRLKISSSILYMALGMLMAEGKIAVLQQGLDYKISLL
ncbi:hypothetical protein Dip510_001208 [Elusimicrobium posterum]|uniref:hypothetical protein n=1 Tax=Elusimicrobium posterum TaxID=3116653 RepID=UPI003C70FC55